MENPLATLQDGTLTQACLLMAFELSDKKWRLGFSDGRHGARHVTVEAGAKLELMAAIGKAKAHFKLTADARVVSCYEAGRDGFWLHRFLAEQGIENRVVDSASIEVNRRARHAKTDRLDVDKLLAMLMRYWGGERRVWHVVRVPSATQEDARRPHREAERLKKERTQHSNRIRSLLVLHNIRVKRVGGRGFDKCLRSWEGKLPEQLLGEIGREAERLKLVDGQLAGIAAQRKAALVAVAEERQIALGAQVREQILRLAQLSAIGVDSAWVLVLEFFGWRQFDNRGEVGAAAGLTGTPFDSGALTREQGITKAGNKRVRWLIVELAWSWLRYQPDSALSVWFRERFGAGKRTRRIGIVALARRLLIELWRYLEQGVIPQGAKLKAR